MKISVLIAAYRAARFIPTALACVRAQTHADWELIVVEDGSRDETAALVDAFASGGPQSVRYENLGSNHGVSAVRNRLLALASGEAVAWLDADDVWTPDHLANAVALLSEQADLVVSSVTPFDLATGREFETVNPPTALLTQPARTLFSRSVIVTCSCVVLRRAMALRVGEFDSRFRIGEDRDFWLRVALAGGRFASTGVASCRYAKHAGSTMARTLVVAGQVVQFYEKHRELSAVPAATRRRLLAASLVTHGRLLRASEPALAARCFWNAWSLQPMHIQALGQLAFTGWRSATSSR